MNVIVEPFEYIETKLELAWRPFLKILVDHIYKKYPNVKHDLQISPKINFPIITLNGPSHGFGFAQRANGISIYFSEPQAIDLMRTIPKIKVGKVCSNILKSEHLDVKKILQAIDLEFEAALKDNQQTGCKACKTKKA